MIICSLSDTHGFHRKVKIPSCDVLVCAGDITLNGEAHTLFDFINWFQEQPAKKKVCVFGNHETKKAERELAASLMRDNGIHYLEDSGVEIDGIHFWGHPWSVECGWAFGLSEKQAKEKYSRIPKQINVLVGHGPAYGIMDDYRHFGSKELLLALHHLPNLKLFIHGHTHSGHGQTTLGNIKIVNASICTNGYEPLNNPITIEI